VLVGLLGWAWWPGPQYTPVRPDERGTIGSLVSATSTGLVHGGRPTLGAPDVRSTATPRMAVALVPRTPGSGPVLLLARPAGAGAGAGGTGPRRTSDTGGTGGQATGRAFPFAVPPAAGPGDNQAVALARPMAVCSTTSRTPWCG